MLKITMHRVNPDFYEVLEGGDPTEYTVARVPGGWMVRHVECGDMPDWSIHDEERPYVRYRDARFAALIMADRDSEGRANAEIEGGF